MKVTKYTIRTVNYIWTDLPAAHLAVEGENNVVFLFSKTSMLDVWSKIIKPS
jgi:hypothetical protein